MTVQAGGSLPDPEPDQCIDQESESPLFIGDWVYVTILEFAEHGLKFTADDVRERLYLKGIEPGFISGGEVGAAFLRARKNGRIQSTNQIIRSTHAENHARHLVVWKGRAVQSK